MPTVVPPLVQSVGGEDCGPNTAKAIVPLAPAVAPDSVPLIELAAIAVPATSLGGAETLVLVVVR